MSTKKRTVLRTVRLSQDLDDLLRNDAEESGTTVNGLINRIMTKYLEWDRHIEKFKFVSIARETFRSFLDKIDDADVEKIATDMGSKMPVAITFFWFKKLNLETVLKTISNYGKYSGLQTNEITANDGNCIITFYHELGAKWSIFLKYFICQFVKTALGITPKTEITDDLVLVSFNTTNRKART